MSEGLTAGLLMTGKIAEPARYRPIVIKAHTGLYIAVETFGSSTAALAWAQVAVEDGSYAAWHFHKLVTE